MRIGLFIPCYIDAFFPEVGVATLELLERLGHEVVYPRDQTCCGQPMANSGFNAECADTEVLFVRNFSGFDYIVAPSGSCVHHVRDNFDAIEQTTESEGSSGAHLRDRRVPARHTEGGCLSVGPVSASRRIAQQLRHPAPAQARHTLRIARAVLLETDGSALRERCAFATSSEKGPVCVLGW